MWLCVVGPMTRKWQPTMVIPNVDGNYRLHNNSVHRYVSLMFYNGMSIHLVGHNKIYVQTDAMAIGEDYIYCDLNV